MPAQPMNPRRPRIRRLSGARPVKALVVLVTVSVLASCSSESPTSVVQADSGVDGSTPVAPAPDSEPTSITLKRPPLIELDALAGDSGTVLDYATTDDETVLDLSALGDINGDGMPDFSISSSLETRVIFGSGTRLPLALDRQNLGSVNGFVLGQGLRLRALGDLDGDAIDDVGWLTVDTKANSTGARVVFGRADGLLADQFTGQPDEVGSMALSNSVRVRDIRSIAPAGDLNADGIDDLLVGSYAYNAEDFDSPTAWVVYGRRDRAQAVLDVSTLTSGDGLTLFTGVPDAQQAAVHDNLGTGYDASITGGFDLDADGVDDIAIGASTFDWIERTGESRTSVVYGSAARTAGRLDLAALDGSDGTVIGGPQISELPSPDGVSPVGDIDADGFDDLGLRDELYTGGTARVLFASPERLAATVDRSTLSSTRQLIVGGRDSSNENFRLRKAGDIDDDGIDDLGVQSDAQAAFVYGTDSGFPARVDPAAPSGVDLTVLDGSDGGELVALGDIDSDGIDDLGIGWIFRPFNANEVAIGDINGDGVDDVGINSYRLDDRNLLRVLYGFGSDGFVGEEPDAAQPAPLQEVAPAFFNSLLASIDAAARSPIAYLTGELNAGRPLGPTAIACLGSTAGLGEEGSERFTCADDPLGVSFEWGAGKYTGTAGGRFQEVAFANGVVQAFDYSSVPLPQQSPGGNPYQAHVRFERSGELSLGQYDPSIGTVVPACVIDVATRLTTSDATECALLIERTADVLSRIFGARSEVRELMYLP